MKNTALAPTLLALAAIGLAAAPTGAQTTQPEAEAKNLPQAQGERIDVPPGNQPTRSVGEAVEPIDQSNTQSNLQGEKHPPTARVGEAVPPMTPRATQ
jgi:hypothetical protein